MIGPQTPSYSPLRPPLETDAESELAVPASHWGIGLVRREQMPERAGRTHGYSADWLWSQPAQWGALEHRLPIREGRSWAKMAGLVTPPEKDVASAED